MASSLVPFLFNINREKTDIIYFLEKPLAIFSDSRYNREVLRRVAQFGRARRSGRRGRRFKSCHADFKVWRRRSAKQTLAGANPEGSVLLLSGFFLLLV